MVDDLVADQRLAIDAAKRVVDAAERAGDQASADLGVRRIEVHEKNAWMLRSHLE
jgi:starvation-inducible DNA-binding protein